MSLPEKEYYSLQEIAVRWRVTIDDLRYYAIHNALEIMVWLNSSVVNVFRHKETKDGENIPVVSGIQNYEGFIVLMSDALREIFRANGGLIRKFYTPSVKELLEIHENQAGFRATYEDLVISRDERDRFEKLHMMAYSYAPPDRNASRSVSFSGRPSVMHHIKQRFLERCEQRQVLLSLQQEAEYLSGWAEENIKDGQPPKAKTITNAIRQNYRQYIDRLIAPSLNQTELTNCLK